MDDETIVLISFWGGIGVLIVLGWAAERLRRVLPSVREQIQGAWDRIEDTLFPEQAREFGQAMDALFAGFDPGREKRDIAGALRAAVRPEYRCPACTGILLRRTGKYGSFYGCSNYPSCSYTAGAGALRVPK